MEDGVHQTLGQFPELFNRDGVIAYLDAAMAGNRGADQGLWMIVNFGIWGRLFRVGL